jgi:hypothetical protein
MPIVAVPKEKGTAAIGFFIALRILPGRIDKPVRV